jgi:EmrB/QacA subfamily drug resistance transporter
MTRLPDTPTPRHPDTLTPTFALLALGLANLLLAQDLAALNVALPTIERDLNSDLSTAQWVVNAYLLVYGMVIVTGGRLADELGRRRVFLIGAALFAAASLLAGFAPNISSLIGARAVMGIGSGLMLPAVAGMSYAVVSPQQAERAGGLVVGAYGLGMAIGPMIGGAITEYLGWRGIQFANLPLAALVIVGIWRTVPPEPAGTRPRIDVPGIITLSAGLVALLFALDQASSWGWGDRRIQLSLALAVLFILAFILVERRAGADALIPADIVRIPGVALQCVLRALMAPAYVASTLYLPQVMQKIFGFTPVQAGFGLLPMLGAYAVVSFLVASLAGSLSVRFAIVAGMACLALGPFLLSGFSIAAGYTGLVAGMAVSGIGLGLFQPSSTTAAVQADDRGRKSLASGLVLMFQFVGGAIGLGITTTIVASAERAAVDNHLASAGLTLPQPERDALAGVLAGAESAQQVMQQFDPAVAGRLLKIASEAFAAGVRAGFRLDALLAAAGFILAALFLGHLRKQPRHSSATP